MSADIIQLFNKAYEVKASDVHISYGIPAVFRINGNLEQMGNHHFTSNDLKEMLDTILPEDQKDDFYSKGEIDFKFSLENISHFRINAYRERGEIAIAARLIPFDVPSLEKLGMPQILYELIEKPQGLILVTGPTGSGKSTTLAAMIDSINKNSAKHIVTIEDPIEYIHENKNSIIHQREVGLDTESFASGLRASLRQDPDVILVGEMRDLETISTAITAAETGHLVLATLHTNSAVSTIDRIIDVFPPFQQNQVRTQIANVVLGVISQRLFVKSDGTGRVAATEILVQTPSVSNLIRSEKVHQIKNVLQTNRSLGMHTLESSILQLINDQVISYEEAKPYLAVGDIQ